MKPNSPAEYPASSPESETAPTLCNPEHNPWRLVNHGLAWTLLGVLILALAGLCALLGETMEIIASSTNGRPSGAGWGMGSPAAGKHLLVIKIFFFVSGIATPFGLIAFTTGLALSGALSPVRPARWLAFASLGACYAAVYGMVSAIVWYQPKEQFSGKTNEATVHTVTSLLLAGMGILLAILLGQALLASLAAAWNDQRTIARIKWYLKCQFALPFLLLLMGIGCGLLLPPGVAMILITTAVNISYVYLAVQLLRNIYLLHRGILWQLEPERAKVAAAPPPQPVIDPLAD